MGALILKTVLKGIGLGALLVLVCAVGIRKGAVGILIVSMLFGNV